jgi:SynChlorMet cassette radical SAM/SPASM protein ScmF
VKAVASPPLRDLYVYTTNLCNCRCKHCWIIDASAAGDRGAFFLDPEVYEQAVLEAKPLGLRSVKLTGGEPTIHPRLDALLDIQKRHGLAGRMETNGLEVTPALARRLADAKFTIVSVSLDGARASTHDAIRGVAGAFERTTRAVRLLVEAGLNTQVIMCLMRDNIEDLVDLVRLAEMLGAKSVKFNVLQPTLRGEKLYQEGQALDVCRIIETSRFVDKELRQTTKLQLYMHVPMAFRPIRNLVCGCDCGVCSIETILGLLADGHYAVCGIGEHVPEMVLGRAGKGELASVWQGHPVLVGIRQGLPFRLQGVCGRCLMKRACRGSCVAQNYYRTRDLFAPFWFCEAAEREGLFPSTRLASPATKGRGFP